MNTRDTVASLLLVGLAAVVLSMALVLPFRARQNASASDDGRGSTMLNGANLAEGQISSIQLGTKVSQNGSSQVPGR